MHDASPTPIPIRNNELQQCGVVSPVGKREERRHTMFHTVWLTAWLTALPMKTNGGGTCDGEKGPADCMEDLAGGIHISKLDILWPELARAVSKVARNQLPLA